MIWETTSSGFIPFLGLLACMWSVRKILMHHDRSMHGSSMNAPGFSGSFWVTTTGAHVRQKRLSLFLLIWWYYSFFAYRVLPQVSVNVHFEWIKIGETVICHPSVIATARKIMARNGRRMMWFLHLFTCHGVIRAGSARLGKKRTQASGVPKKTYDHKPPSPWWCLKIVSFFKLSSGLSHQCQPTWWITGFEDPEISFSCSRCWPAIFLHVPRWRSE